MNIVRILGIAGIAATTLAATITVAAAQGGRDAAMHNCLVQARSNFPNSGGADASQDQNRTAFYKSCMTRAGFAP